MWAERVMIRGVRRASCNFAPMTEFLETSGDASAEIPLKNVDHVVNFFAPPPPFAGFVANKRLTAIRKDCRQDCRSLFSRFFDLESHSIFSVVPIAKFTLWLTGKPLLIAALRRLNLLVFKDLVFKEISSTAYAAGSVGPTQMPIISFFIRHEESIFNFYSSRG